MTESNSTEAAGIAEDSVDAFYYATAFKTIASLAMRCLNEGGNSSHDMLWGIQKLAEGFSVELGGDREY